jgi:hypothetical protein
LVSPLPFFKTLLPYLVSILSVLQGVLAALAQRLPELNVDLSRLTLAIVTHPAFAAAAKHPRLAASVALFFKQLCAV